MKTQRTLVNMLALAALFTVTQGCQKTTELTPASKTPVLIQGMSARINNQAWQTASSAPAIAPAYYASRGGINPGQLYITGFGTFPNVNNGGNTDKITIILANVTGTGTYALTGDSQAIYTTLLDKQPVHYATTSDKTGTVVLTKYDLTNGLISGTFSFNSTDGKNVVTVTEGQLIDVPISR